MLWSPLAQTVLALLKTSGYRQFLSSSPAVLIVAEHQDDRQWPRQIVTSITDTGVTPNTTTTFAYTLNQACGSGCTQDTWIPPNAWNACGDSGVPPNPPDPNQLKCLDGNWVPFYDEVYTGFAQVGTTQSDLSNTVTQYYAGNGWGTNDWDVPNLQMGMLVTEDLYQGSTGGTPLLETHQSYTDGTYCPVVTVPTPNGPQNEQLYINPYLFCFALETSRDTYVGGSSSSTPAVPHLTQTWTYNTGSDSEPQGKGMDHFFVSLNAAATKTNDMLADSFTNYGSTQPTFTSSYSYTWHDGTLDGSFTKTYLINLPAQVTLDDSASPSNRWTCTRLSYDGQAYGTGENAGILDGLTTRNDVYSDATCGSSNVITNGSGYDSFGQLLVTTDADALASPAVPGHTGCTASATPLVVFPSGASAYTACASYDSAQHLYLTAAANAKSQSAAAAWDVLQAVPISSTDINAVTTTYGGPVYEYNGPISLANYQDTYTQTVLPLETYTDGGNTGPWTTRVFNFSFCAGATSGTAPCLETDTVRQLDNSSDLAVTRQFYDRDGRLVETRMLGPTAGTDTVTYTAYDETDNPRRVFQSVPCQVASLSTSNGGRGVTSTNGYIAPTQTSTGSSAFVDPATTSSASCKQSALAGTTTYNDELGHVVASDDPLDTGTDKNGGTGCALALDGGHHHTTCTVYTAVVASSTQGLPSTDSEPYLQTLTVDANLHQQAVYTDALGRTAYAQRFTGGGQTPGSGITSYAVSSYLYDPLGQLRKVSDAQGNVTTFTYDDAGRMTASSDPDLGSWSYAYDANGNLVQQTDARGATGNSATTGRVNLTYDGLDRLLSVTPDGGSTPYACYVYDGGGSSSCPSVPGLPSCPNSGATNLVGRLCQETFASGPNQEVTGGYGYSYDQRGRTTGIAFSIQGPSFAQTSYTLTPTYDDVDRTSTLAYPTLPGLTAETLSFGYNNTAGGELSSIISNVSSPTSTLMTNPTYNAQGLLTGWQSGMGSYQATLSLSYDGDLRLADRKLASTPYGGSATTVADMQPTYDAAGNVATLTTTLGAVGSTAGGTETQVFCYDEQNRLTWASTMANNCGHTASEGIYGAGYTVGYTYDTLGRVTSALVNNQAGSALGGAAQGTFTYSDPNHLHAVTSVGAGSTGYSASYDAAGDETCRQVGNASACNSSFGQTLQDDALRQLIQVQTASTCATCATDSYAYDGSGQRVWQQVVQQNPNATTTTSTWIDGLGVGEQRTFVTTGQSPTSTGHEYLPTPGGVLTVRDTTSGLTYDVTDVLGTPIASLNLAGGVLGASLAAPYGQNRYIANAAGPGGLQTAKGFTGQYQDISLVGSSQLDDFNARYYDPVIGRFTSADTAQPGLGDPLGLDNYGYVGGQVESATDPTGHIRSTHRDECPECLETINEPDASADGSSMGSPSGLPEGYENAGKVWYPAGAPVEVSDGVFYFANADGTGEYVIGGYTFGVDAQGNVTSVNGIPESQWEQESAGLTLQNEDMRTMGAQDAKVVNVANTGSTGNTGSTDNTESTDNTGGSGSGSSSSGGGNAPGGGAPGEGSPPDDGVPGSPGSPGGAGPNNPAVPQNAYDTAQYANDNGGAARPGYVGDRTYQNDGRGGTQRLDQVDANGNPITYREYDVRPYVQGVNRGQERVVIGSDGRIYYTPSHYSWFFQFFLDSSDVIPVP